MRRRGRVASAQDGGLGGAVPAIAERAPARRAGAVCEARDAAPSGPGPGEPDGVGLGTGAPSWSSGRTGAAGSFWNAAPQGAEWNATRVLSLFPASRGWQRLLPRDRCLGTQVCPLNLTSSGSTPLLDPTFSTPRGRRGRRGHPFSCLGDCPGNT